MYLHSILLVQTIKVYQKEEKKYIKNSFFFKNDER